ncbi:hypothetical protein RhiirA4_460674 [Rhizophagus irregularis]|uniref:Uncharacterized protein n=1 Tax=Rhizophagus irregularis TaxID=588596 RepID=A0A2I1GH34_9GLOM|nr:hypothetical protein RhiirA4_460674 [Rhizophagus irregularis]
MVDPVIERTVQLIDSQLHLCNNDCFALSLVGKFAKSIYFQLRIGETFNKGVYHKLKEKLQEDYNDLTNKYNEEANQHQLLLKNLKVISKDTEEKYLKNIQELENQINDINQHTIIDIVKRSVKHITKANTPI